MIPYSRTENLKTLHYPEHTQIVICGSTPGARIAHLSERRFAECNVILSSSDFQCKLGSAYNCLQPHKSCNLYALHAGPTTDVVRSHIHESGVLRMRR